MLYLRQKFHWSENISQNINLFFSFCARAAPNKRRKTLAANTVFVTDGSTNRGRLGIVILGFSHFGLMSELHDLKWSFWVAKCPILRVRDGRRAEMGRNLATNPIEIARRADSVWTVSELYLDFPYFPIGRGLKRVWASLGIRQIYSSVLHWRDLSQLGH